MMATPPADWDFEARLRALRSDDGSLSPSGDELETCSDASPRADKTLDEVNMVDVAIGASVNAQLQQICDSQRDLGAVADRIWGLLVQLEQKLDNCLPVERSPSVCSGDTLDRAAEAMIKKAKHAAAKQLQGVDTASHGAGTAVEDLSFPPSSDSKYDTSGESVASTAKSSVISLNMYDLEKLSTDHLFASSGLAPSASFLKHSSLMFRGFGTGGPPRPPRMMPSTSKVCPAPPSPTDPSPPSSEAKVMPLADARRVPEGTVLLDIRQAEERAGSKDSVSPGGRRRSHMSSMDELRVEHDSRLVVFEDQLTGLEPGDSFLSHILRRIPKLFLRIFGVLLFNEGRAAIWYTKGVLALVAGIVCHCLVTAVYETECLYLHLSTACYAFGGFIGAASLWVQHLHCLLGPVQKPLVSYAQRQNFFDEWQKLSLRRFAVIFAMWSLIVATRFLSTINTACQGGHCVWPWNSASFIFVTGLLAALAYCQVYVCCALELAIDTYCCSLHEDLDVERGIAAWSMLQAVLRRSAQTVDTCFLSMNTTVLATLLLTGIEVLRGKRPVLGSSQHGNIAYDDICWCVSVLSQMALLLYTVFRAAAVTEKCSRVPALVNSWMFAESQRDESRQYIVQHIASSNAGFYVKGVRLTALMALKLAYIFGIIAFTLVSDSIIV